TEIQFLEIDDVLHHCILHLAHEICVKYRFETSYCDSPARTDWLHSVWLMTSSIDIEPLQRRLAQLRRDLHREPEVGLDLPWTQQKVIAALEGLPLEVTLGEGLSSVTAVLRGRRGGETVLLRGDMDALPITEETGLEFTSRSTGRMHACGHDLHTAMLVGAVHLLVERRDELDGDVVFMF